MYKFFLLVIFLFPLLNYGQEANSLQIIDSVIKGIDKNQTLVKKIYDTTSYQKVDGGNEWDSLYVHREYFYMDDQIVKISGWKKYGTIRQDLLVYYYHGKPIKYSEGESFKGRPDYGLLNFAVYYHNDKDIGVVWLTKKPDNVLGVGVDTFLEIAYYIRKNVLVN